MAIICDFASEAGLQAWALRQWGRCGWEAIQAARGMDFIGTLALELGCVERREPASLWECRVLGFTLQYYTLPYYTRNMPVAFSFVCLATWSARIDVLSRCIYIYVFEPVTTLG